MNAAEALLEPAQQVAALLNDVAVTGLEKLRDRAKPSDRDNAGYYLLELDRLWYDLRNIAIEERANRWWIVYDEDTLRAMFLRYERDQKFDIPTDDCAIEDEPWAMALQLGYENIIAQPPLLPTFSRRAIEEWLREPGRPAGQLRLL